MVPKVFLDSYCWLLSLFWIFGVRVFKFVKQPNYVLRNCLTFVTVVWLSRKPGKPKSNNQKSFLVVVSVFGGGSGGCGSCSVVAFFHLMLSKWVIVSVFFDLLEIVQQYEVAVGEAQHPWLHCQAALYHVLWHVIPAIVHRPCILVPLQPFSSFIGGS